MKVLFVTATIVGVTLIYGADLHATSALDYNGVRAIVAQMIASLKS